jgi:FdhD protein
MRVSGQEPAPQPIGRPVKPASRPIEPILRTSSGVSGLAVETPVAIEVNGVPTATLICSPESLDELVAGWCFGQGFIDSRDDISRLTVRGGRAVVMLKRSLPGGHDWRVQLASGFDASHIRFPAIAAATPPPRDGFVLDARTALALIAELYQRFGAQPGGLYDAGATDGATVLTTVHDIGRHNALDKLVGWSVLAHHDLSPFVVAITGRMCASTVYRAARAGVRILASNGAPTAQAVKVAQGAGLTLISEVESAQRTIYSHPWRIERGRT